MILRRSTLAIILAILFLFVGGTQVMMADDSRGMYPGDARSAAEEARNMTRGELEAYGIVPTQAGLLAGLKHKERPARLLSLQLLAVTGDLQAIGPIGELLKDPEGIVQESSLRAINAIVLRHTKPWAEKLYLEAKFEQDRFNRAILLCELGIPDYYYEVLKIIRDSKKTLFISAIRNVPKFAKYRLYGDGKHIEIEWEKELSNLLMDNKIKANKRIEVVNALQQINSLEALSVLKKALSLEENEDVKKVLQNIINQNGNQ